MCKQDEIKPKVVQGIRRIVYIGFGFGFLVLAFFGVILPILPATPLVLLSSYFFLRSSPRLNDWLLRSRLFGFLLRDWQERRGVRRSVKYTAVALVVCAVAGSAYFGRLSIPLTVLLCVVGVIGLYVVLRLPVVKHSVEDENN